MENNQFPVDFPEMFNLSPLKEPAPQTAQAAPVASPASNTSTQYPANSGEAFDINFPVANPDQQAPTDAVKMFSAVPSAGSGEEARKIANAALNTYAINEFPKHLFCPEGVESVDLRVVANIVPATVDLEILRFVAPPGAVTRFIKYGIFNDGDAEANYDFKPLVNGNRILRYHGHPIIDPVTQAIISYHLALGLGPDLSDTSMIPYLITLQPGDILQWLVTNNSLVDTAMGVRMTGYFDTQQIRVAPKFG